MLGAPPCVHHVPESTHTAAFACANRGCCCCCTAGLCCSTPEGPGEAQCWELQCVGGQRGNANGIAARRYTAAGAQGERDAAQAGLGGWDVPHCNSMWCRGGSACSGHAAVSWWPCRGHLVAVRWLQSGCAITKPWLCDSCAVATAQPCSAQGSVCAAAVQLSHSIGATQHPAAVVQCW